MKFKAPTLEPVYLSTTQGGHTFVVGTEYTEVPKMFRAAALAAGCTFEGMAVEEPEAEIVADENASKLLDAVREMIAKGDPADFTSGGKASATRLSAMVGYTVTSDQRDAAWEAASRE